MNGVSRVSRVPISDSPVTLPASQPHNHIHSKKVANRPEFTLDKKVKMKSYMSHRRPTRPELNPVSTV